MCLGIFCIMFLVWLRGVVFVSEKNQNHVFVDFYQKLWI